MGWGRPRFVGLSFRRGRGRSYGLHVRFVNLEPGKSVDNDPSLGTLRCFFLIASQVGEIRMERGWCGRRR